MGKGGNWINIGGKVEGCDPSNTIGAQRKDAAQCFTVGKIIKLLSYKIV
jgi:hypothetical protein